MSPPGVLANDSDPDGDPITAQLVNGPANGTLDYLDSSGSFSYTPNPGFLGGDSFSYQATDGLGTSAPVTVTITVTNTAPVATPNSYGVQPGATLNVAAIGVLAGDSDADGDFLTAALVSAPSNGAFVFNTDGSFSYTPNQGFTGVDYFTYKANDGVADSNTATVSLDVNTGVSTIAVSDVQLLEGNTGTTNAVFLVQVTPGHTSIVTVAYSTADGTAASNQDYSPVSGVLTFNPGTDSLQVLVPVVGDSWAEGSETFVLNLTNASSNAMIVDGLGEGTILDDEAVVTIAASDANAAESGTDPATFTVSRTGDTSADLIVFYQIQGSAGNGVDYSVLTGSVVITAGSNSATLNVTPVDDTTAEGTETAQVFLTTAASYHLGVATSDIVWIADDDGPVAGPNLDLTAYRPQSPPFRRTPVAAGTEDTIGAGIRSNGDDDNTNGIPDWNEVNVAGENDLIEISFDFGAQQAPQGIEYYLKRNNANVRVWDSATKGGAVLNANNEQQIPFAPGLSLWVEWVNPTFAAADASLTFEASANHYHDAREPEHANRVGGSNDGLGHGVARLQVPTDPPQPNQGVFVIGKQLYDQAYDVHMYAEGVQNDRGANIGRGGAYNEVVNGVNNRRVSSVAVFGYSWGGGATFNLVNRLNADAAAGIIQNPFSIPFTAYIDAIRHGNLQFGVAETRRPPGSQFHVNYFQRIGSPGVGINLRGDAVPGADFELNVNTTQWGGNLDHFTIEDDVGGGQFELLGLAGRNVLNGVRDRLLARVNR